MERNLDLYNAPLPKEKVYFALVLTISIIVWGLVAILIFPIFYALIAFIAIWFGNGLLIAQLKADGIKVDADQLPELDAALRDVCAKLEIQQVPDLYIIQSGGLLNAFATRHAGRNFVVIYSDILEAHGPNSSEIKFLLGHELGHIKQNHIIKQLLLFPGRLVPLLGNAYSRACETSCDRFGALATGDINAAINSMMLLSGGKTANATMNPVSFAKQYSKMRGFFVSWYELISGYPTLSQRVAHLLALKDGQPVIKAPRNPVAYLFAFFTIGGKGTGLANLMITIAVIGLLAAIGIPSIIGAYSTAQMKTKARNVAEIKKAKAVLTLPSGTIAGAMDADDNTSLATGTAGGSNILAILQINSLSELNVGTNVISIGTMTTEASY